MALPGCRPCPTQLRAGDGHRVETGCRRRFPPALCQRLGLASGLPAREIGGERGAQSAQTPQQLPPGGTALERSAAKAVHSPLPACPRYQAHLQTLRRAGIRGNAALPVVRHRPDKARGRNLFPGVLLTLPTRDEAGLALLPLVLRSRIRAALESRIPRCPLLSSLWEPGVLAAGADATYALLPMVPDEGEEALACSRSGKTLPRLRPRRSDRLLGSLSMVRNRDRAKLS